PETNSPSNSNNHPLQQPADNSLRTPAQHDAPVNVSELPNFKFANNGSGHLDIGPDGVHTAHSQADVNQSDSFKFANNDSAHPGTVVPHDSPTLTTLSSDSSGTHGPAAPALASTVNVPGTVLSDAALDKFIFVENVGHGTVAGHKPDMTEIDHTVPADIQHLQDTTHDTNAVGMLDPTTATAPQDMTKVKLPHQRGDFHFAKGQFRGDRYKAAWPYGAIDAAPPRRRGNRIERQRGKHKNETSPPHILTSGCSPSQASVAERSSRRWQRFRW